MAGVSRRPRRSPRDRRRVLFPAIPTSSDAAAAPLGFAETCRRARRVPRRPPFRAGPAPRDHRRLRTHGACARGGRHRAKAGRGRRSSTSNARSFPSMRAQMRCDGSPTSSMWARSSVTMSRNCLMRDEVEASARASSLCATSCGYGARGGARRAFAFGIAPSGFWTAGLVVMLGVGAWQRSASDRDLAALPRDAGTSPVCARRRHRRCERAFAPVPTMRCAHETRGGHCPRRAGADGERDLAGRRKRRRLPSPLLPLLRTAAAARLAALHGIDLVRSPAEAHARLGDDAWDLLRPDRPAPVNRHGPGVPREVLAQLIARVEGL